jgi:hypothetical protein
MQQLTWFDLFVYGIIRLLGECEICEIATQADELCPIKVKLAVISVVNSVEKLSKVGWISTKVCIPNGDIKLVYHKYYVHN